MGIFPTFLRLCNKYDIHLLSDEVYVKSWFPSDDFPDPPPFVSVLSLDLKQSINPAQVHVLYALSKDFCANGLRMGFVCTSNQGIIGAMSSIGFVPNIRFIQKCILLMGCSD